MGDGIEPAATNDTETQERGASLTSMAAAMVHISRR
jgi:hypothetical protein